MYTCLPISYVAYEQESVCWELYYFSSLVAARLGGAMGVNQGQGAAQVRSKALIQYTAPFVSVDLRTMAAAFSADVECGASPPKAVPLLIFTACARRDHCL